jgi:hypothetical protein
MPEALTTFENGRLARAYERIQVGGVDKLGPRQFQVQGNDEPTYFVDLDGDPPCYCKDSQWHGRGCLHEIAGLLMAKDALFINAIAEKLLKEMVANRENGTE